VRGGSEAGRSRLGEEEVGDERVEVEADAEMVGFADGDLPRRFLCQPWAREE
jgi:hypothetical protein